jgi:hypothetical protein
MDIHDNTPVSFDKPDTVELYMPSFLKFVSDNCPKKMKHSFDNFISEHRDCIFWYPDGTLQISVPDVINIFKNTEYHQYAYQKETDIITDQCNLLKKPIDRIIDRITYTSLPPWSNQDYLIYHCEPFMSQLPDESIFFHLKDDIHPERQKFYESPIESVPIHIVFKRKLDKKAREQFTHVVAQWITDIENNKIFGGGRILVKENGVTFYSKVAHFTIDASQSNQTALNWLILLLIDFCHHTLITDVFFMRFKYVEEFVDEEIFSTIAENYKSMYPLSVALRMTQQQASSFIKYKQTTFGDAYHLTTQQKTTLLFSQLNHKIISRSQNNIDNEITKLKKEYKGVFPNDVIQHSVLHSDKFPIFITPQTTYDHLWITIIFDSKISDKLKQQLIKDISLWLQLGFIGGFGGTFSAHYNPEFDTEYNILHFFVDHGNTNITLSLSVLVNIVETWDMSGITICAMLLDNQEYKGNDVYPKDKLGTSSNLEN